MTNQCRLLLIHLLILAFCAWLPLSTKADIPETELGGRLVRASLVKANDLTPEEWPSGAIKLATATVITRAGDSITDLLKANGIRADVEGFTLLYDLNPGLLKPDTLPAGRKLVLPTIVGGAELKQKLGHGYVVMLTVDKQIKDEVRSDAALIEKLAAGFAALPTARFANADRSQATIEAVKQLAIWFEHIQRTFAQRRARPLRRETLLVIKDEAELLRSMLEQSQTEPVSAATQEQILAIHNDIKVEIERWDNVMAGELPAGEPQFKVTVIIRGDNADLIKSLRVYCVVNGSFRDPPVNPPVRSRSFDSLGSGSSRMLPIKNFKIWAAQDGNPAIPVTAIKDLEVRQPSNGDEITIELSLRP
jgi:hypothetical protein